MPRQGSAGALAVAPSKQRLAAILKVDERLFPDRTTSQLRYHSWGCVLFWWPWLVWPHFRGHHGLWFVDSVPALMALSRVEAQHLSRIPWPEQCTLCCAAFMFASTGSGLPVGTTGRTGSPDRVHQVNGFNDITFQSTMWTRSSCFSTCHLLL